MTIFDDFLGEIEEDEYQFDEPGENKELYVLGGYRFTVRSERKLARHGLRIEDAMLVLVQENFLNSRTTSSTAAIGRCERGKAFVVIRPVIHECPDDKAKYDVITAYRV